MLAFLRRAAASARYVVSVCTGALVLGAAGLLRGRRAATHWMSREMLPAFGAEPVAERVVVDGNVFTGGGVTAGIDVALCVAAEIAGRSVAEAIQLAIEYDPAPPFSSGSPEAAGSAIVAEIRANAARVSVTAPSASPAPRRLLADGIEDRSTRFTRQSTKVLTINHSGDNSPAWDRSDR